MKVFIIISALLSLSFFSCNQGNKNDLENSNYDFSSFIAQDSNDLNSLDSSITSLNKTIDSLRPPDINGNIDSTSLKVYSKLKEKSDDLKKMVDNLKSEDKEIFKTIFEAENK
jgi:hypothetical protein